MPKVWHTLPRVLRSPSWDRVSVLKTSDTAEAYELPNRDHAFHSLRDVIIRAFQLIDEFERLLIKCFELLNQSLCSRVSHALIFHGIEGCLTSAELCSAQTVQHSEKRAVRDGQDWFRQTLLVPDATGKNCLYCEKVSEYTEE